MAKNFMPNFDRGRQRLSATGFRNMTDSIQSLQTASQANRWNAPNTAWIINKTGSDLEAFNIVQVKQLNTTKFTGADLVAFKQVVIYEANEPVINSDNLTANKETAQNKHAVLMSGCKENQYALVVMYGPTQCKINVSDSKHEWCTPANNTVANMESAVYGESYILDRESGNGMRWGLIWLNAHHHGQSNNPQTDFTSDWKLNDQGTQDGDPATGAKITIITVGEGYTPGAGETLRDFQWDSQGHVVLLEEGLNSSSSQSSGGQSSQSSDPYPSSSSSGFMSSESSASGAAGTCDHCDPDPVKLILTINSLSWGSYNLGGSTIETSGPPTNTADYCEWQPSAYPTIDGVDWFVAIRKYKTDHATFPNGVQVRLGGESPGNNGYSGESARNNIGCADVTITNGNNDGDGWNPGLSSSSYSFNVDFRF